MVWVEAEAVAEETAGAEAAAVWAEAAAVWVEAAAVAEESVAAEADPELLPTSTDTPGRAAVATPIVARPTSESSVMVGMVAAAAAESTA